MKTLIFGAGPTGSLYAYLLAKAGRDVTVLARNQHYDFIKENGIVLVNNFSGEKKSVKVKVIDKLGKNETYDLVIVIMRKNKIPPVLSVLSQNEQLENILFMGNNAFGFENYLRYIPKEKVVFGFPGCAGTREEHIVYYIDSQSPNGKRMPITIGEIDGVTRDRTRRIISLFSSAHVPVKLVDDIDGWLKYHVAFVSPMCNALYKHGANNYELARDKDTVRLFIHACQEGGHVLKALGYRKRYPFQFNLFYWLPEWSLVKFWQKAFNSKFAEYGFSLHANKAVDEFRELALDFKTLADKTAIKTPNIEKLRGFIP